ncbi:hypothetical protein GCM10025876_21240 [Demequina litorisediminis]|uniref:NAD-specific glutamate dehydrogenase n=1 Tax=Demequina litorisediminis TaxID=1849022 RepID=A0ABQ6IDM2_9MICO|nr:hypothetical protein GCM10025876_21240 [Demequina litorisediminis]
MLLALELTHNVHQMFDDAGTGDGPVLGDVPHDDHGEALGLGGLDQRGGHLADLAHAAGSTVDRGRCDGLNGIDHQELRLRVLDLREDRSQIGLRGEEQPRLERVDALGAQPHLSRGLLTGDVEHALALARGAGRHVEQEGRLSHPRLARQEDHRSGDHSAAEHAVELRHTSATAGRRRGGDLRDGGGGLGGGRRLGGGTRWRGTRLLNGSP